MNADLKATRLAQLELVGWLLLSVGALAGEGAMFAGFAVAALAFVFTPGARSVARSPLLWTWLAAVGFALVSATWGQRPLRSGAPWSALHWLFVPLAIVMWRTTRDTTQRAVITLLSIGLALSAALAIVQHFVLFDYPKWLGGTVTTFRVAEPSPIGGYKGGGLHFHRLRFAHSTIALALALWQRWSTRVPSQPLDGGWFATLPWRALRWPLLLLLGLGLLSAFVTAAWGAVVVGVATLAAAPHVSSTLRRVWLGAIATVSVAVPFVLPLFTTHPADRQVAWELARTIWASSPWIGVGFGAYANHATTLIGGTHPEYPLIHLDAHHVWLQLLCEVGIVGSLLFVAAFYAWRRWQGPLSLAQQAIVAALCVLGLVHNWAFHPAVFGAIAVALAVARDQSITREY